MGIRLYYYRKWTSLEEFDLLLDRLCGSLRIKRNQNVESSVGIIDNQSAKWGNNRSLNGIDDNKKIKGVKRHVVINKNGFLIAVLVTIANVHDSKLIRVLKELYAGVKIILTDGRYRDELIGNVKTKFGYIIQVVVSAYKE